MGRASQRLIRKYAVVGSAMSALFGLYSPTFYLMLLDKGLTLGEVGTAVAASTVCAIGLDVPFGALADRIGRKRMFLLAEAVLLAVVAGFWLARSYVALLLAMAFNGVCRSMFSGTLDALFVDQLNEQAAKDGERADMEGAQATLGLSAHVTLAVGAIVGGCLPGWLAPLTRGSAWVGRYEVVYVVMLPLVAVHWVATALVIEGERPRSVPAESAPRPAGALTRTLRAVRATPLLSGLIASQFIAGMTLVALDVLWQPRVAQLVDANRAGWLFGVITSLGYVAGAVGHALAPRLGRLFKHHLTQVLWVLELCIAGAFALLAMQGHVVGLCLAYFVLQVLAGATVPPALTLFHKKLEDDFRATALSARSCVEQIGTMFGALLAGTGSEHLGIRAVWLGAGGVVLAGTFLYRLAAINDESVRLSESLGSDLGDRVGAVD